MKGKLYLNDDKVWKIKYQYGDVKLREEDITEKLEEGQEVMFMYEKKFLALETLWFAKIIPQQESWEDIVNRFNNDHGWDDDTCIPYSVQLWLEDNYYPPKKK
jgi:hypothetical protein